VIVENELTFSTKLAQKRQVTCNAMTPPSKSDSFFKDYINTFAYFHKNNQKIAAINLWTNGFKVFHGATIVKGFDIYEKIPFTETNPPDLKAIMPFINDSLMDDTRIITCFENFMKGVLIINDYVVHKLTNKNKALKYEQQKRPLKIAEVFNQTSFSNFDKTRPDMWETSFQTLNFSWMLKPKYQAIINLPNDVLSIIADINDERNKLHFISVGVFQFGKSTIEKYSKIIEFANVTIKKCILDLDSSMKAMLEKIQAQQPKN